MTISANFPTVRPSLLLDFSNQTVLDPRVTFARTTTAYYYDNKSAALAEQNLLTYSNTLTNAAWSKVGVGTPVLNATDPTGTASGAYTVTASIGSSTHYLSESPSTASSTYTFSAYLQAGTNNFATLTVASTVTSWVAVTFNLTSGSVAISQTLSGAGGGVTSVSSALTQVGSTNWWRCSVTFSTTSTAVSTIIQINDSATPSITGSSSGLQTWTALGTETLLVYGAQVEQRSAPTVYTATTATAVNTYTPTLQSAAINSPRFDYNPTTRESLGLLLEQAATNLALYSSDYTNAAWTKTNCTITPTASVSPDGTQNASLMVLGTTSVVHHIAQAVTFTAATYTFSAYVKYYGQQFVQIVTAAGSTICNFDILNGVAGTPSGSTSPTASIQSVGNGWYRCAIIFTPSAGATNFYIFASNSLTAAANPAFAGNGFNGYLIWGAQVELARSATSYIANTSIANNRTVDSASMTGTNFTSWYNYSGGTLYLESSIANVSAATSMIGITDSASSVSAILMQTLTAGAGFQNYVSSPSSVAAINAYLPVSATLANNTFYKSALAYSVTGVALVGGGGTVATTANNPLPPSVNQLILTNPPVGPYGSTNITNGRIKKFAYYPLALTNTQIQSLSAN